MHVLIAEHLDIILDALTTYLAMIDSNVVIDRARDFVAAMEKLDHAASYDLVIVDDELPGMNGLRGLVDTVGSTPKTPLALLAAEIDPSDVMFALASGISAYVARSMKGAVIRGALTLALHGERYAPSPVVFRDADRIREGGQDLAPGRDSDNPLNAMTRRQREVVMLLIDGLTNAEIAARLGIAASTVRLHLQQVYRRLGVRNRVEAARVAQRLDRRLLPRK